ARSKKGKVFGPFVSAQERDTILSTLKKIFRLRVCKNMPKRPCLRYHIKLCDAPCIGVISEDNYAIKLKNITKILSGNINVVLDELKEAMQKASDELRFERAIELRDQIESLSYLKERQNMERSKKYDEDIINYTEKDDNIYLLLFNVYKGTLANKQEFVFEKKEDFLTDFIIQFYSEQIIPKELILPENVDPALEKFLRKKNNEKVNIVVPKRGEKKQLLDLAKENAKITFFGQSQKVQELGNKLKLQSSPEVIETFDVSHLSGTSTVASMVQFRHGVPDKTNYRRFKLKSVDGIDDFKGIAEAVKRRYSRLKKERQNMPDLIIIDGGKGQLKSALEEIQKLGLKIPVISIAKQNEEIFFPYSRHPLMLDKKEKSLKFVQEMRDEAHRFAIKYNRQLRKIK
ncbi:MAG: excinuclease ABC subunit UvrC, partial [Nanobdellota archaeon]